MTRKKIAIGATIIFILIFTIFSLVFSVDTRQSVSLESKSEIESFDFTEEIGYIAADVFEAYPNKMYTPEDFAEQNIKNVSSDSDKDKDITECVHTDCLFICLLARFFLYMRTALLIRRKSG